jgi:hypothetical protein
MTITDLSTCTARTCSAAGDGSCRAPCGWNKNNYCVCGGTGGRNPASSSSASSSSASSSSASSTTGIKTNSEYEATKAIYATKLNEFLSIYNELVNKPCIKYNSNSKGLDKKCLDEVWKKAGCTTTSPYTEDTMKDKTLNDMITDAYNWATNTGSEQRTKCYGAATTGFRTTPKDFNINEFKMTSETGKGFTKDGVGISSDSLAECSNSCLPGSGCISSTYNSTQKKCWSNVGTYSSLKDPTTTDATDTANYYIGFKMLNELDALNKELSDYETKQNDDDKSNNDNKNNPWGNEQWEQNMIYNDDKLSKLEKKIDSDRAEMQKLLEQYRKDLSGSSSDSISGLFNQPMTEETKRILIYILFGIVLLIGIFVLYKLVMMVSGLFSSNSSYGYPSGQMGGGSSGGKFMKMFKRLFKK